MKIKLLNDVSVDELLLLSIDELRRQFSIVSDIQYILNEDLKLWNKRLNGYYETSGELDDDTAELIITASARVKYLQDTMQDVMNIFYQYAHALDIKEGE